ncbi:hypothetical protein GCM10012320_13720 [Sinomonas cellulolyticus]|uniref:DivIVA domain-containing protein n=1 Tax=Sinomonas cellulolyticus TaxID=2801916 RepID=A0ABS1K098_9MICC|nr:MULTISPECIES: DivIVA domain-containing protein [Sinomonas]MBL0704807.1 DivIVA domain-containing protein [Sinomonas cellulolyticus]GHG47182.1 hypothetical protein GCM10012320_13720 [Sinomonas sp. KCTC 49339]
MSFFLVFLAILLAGGLAWFAVGAARGASRGAGSAAGLRGEGLDEPPTGLPPVLLPEHPNPEDIDALRFALAFRGYRMDEVDEVLARLRDRISVQAALIEALTAQLKAAASKADTLSSGGTETGPGPAAARPGRPLQADAAHADARHTDARPDD